MPLVSPSQDFIVCRWWSYLSWLILFYSRLSVLRILDCSLTTAHSFESPHFPGYLLLYVSVIMFINSAHTDYNSSCVLGKLSNSHAVPYVKVQFPLTQLLLLDSFAAFRGLNTLRLKTGFQCGSVEQWGPDGMLGSWRGSHVNAWVHDTFVQEWVSSCWRRLLLQKEVTLCCTPPRVEGEVRALYMLSKNSTTEVHLHLQQCTCIILKINSTSFPLLLYTDLLIRFSLWVKATQDLALNCWTTWPQET